MGAARMTTTMQAQAVPTGRCVYCRREKWSYRSRKAARQAARIKWPGDHQSAYRCQAAPDDVEVWHYGHYTGWRDEHPCDDNGVAYPAPEVHSTPSTVVAAMHRLAARKEPLT
jgi:hypothetical protein